MAGNVIGPNRSSVADYVCSFVVTKTIIAGFGESKRPGRGGSIFPVVVGKQLLDMGDELTGDVIYTECTIIEKSYLAVRVGQPD
jgi:hypothetical protein